MFGAAWPNLPLNKPQIQIHQIIFFSVKLVVAVNPPERLADIGEVVTFNCSVRGHPVTNVRWAKNARLLSDTGRLRVIARNQLMVTSVKREDHGLYQCFASNDRDAAQGTAQLLIGGNNPPEFLHTFENVTVNPGSPVSLKCSASGNPLPQITWSLDGAQ
ncbi:Down syndrome cell adhesion molecule-like protein Dscam2, partial [Araneus ventricosus]